MKTLGLRHLSQDQLLAQCQWDVFRGPGPGGQKRNKTSSSIRLTHEPTGISVIAGESRSQQRNRQVAIARLRHKIALTLREDLQPSDFPAPEVPAPEMPAPEIFAPELLNPKLLDVSRRSAAYPQSLGRVLDALHYTHWSVSDAAKILRISTGRLISFLAADPAAWTEVNRNRQAAGLRPLHP